MLLSGPVGILKYPWLRSAKKWLDQVKPMLHAQPLTREAIDSLLETLFPNPKKHSTNRRIILESAALAYYHHSEYFVHYLMTDDAPQFNKLALHHALCWIQSLAQQLSMQFDTLFAITTGYDVLDQRIAKTRAKKQALLLVLDHPFLPLHNNGSELGARFQARIRDINFQTWKTINL